MGTKVTPPRHSSTRTTIKCQNSKSRHHFFLEDSSKMRTCFVIAALVVCVSANDPDYDKIFSTYAGADHMMDCTEIGNYWMHYDTDGDGNVSKYEFDTEWTHEDIGEKKRAPFFFLELDRVADEQLNALDWPHVCHMFDENCDGQITKREFEFNWKGLFESD